MSSASGKLSCLCGVNVLKSFESNNSVRVMLIYSLEPIHKILPLTCTPLFYQVNFSRDVNSLHSVSVSNVFTQLEKEKNHTE